MTKYKEITHAELFKMRLNQYKKQRGVCPILKQPIEYKDAAFDHCHKKKSEVAGKNGKGLLRGVLHFQANAFEGKVSRSFVRTGLHKFGISLPDALRNLANYLEKPPMKPEFIHPDERNFKKLAKKDYNVIKKFYFQMYPKKRKIPGYPKSGRTNDKWEEMLKKAREIKNG